MTEKPKTPAFFELDWGASVSVGEVLSERKDGTAVIRVSGYEVTLRGQLVKQHGHGGADAEHRFVGPVEILKAVEIKPAAYKMVILPAILQHQIETAAHKASRIVQLPMGKRAKRARS